MHTRRLLPAALAALTLAAPAGLAPTALAQEASAETGRAVLSPSDRIERHIRGLVDAIRDEIRAGQPTAGAGELLQAMEGDDKAAMTRPLMELARAASGADLTLNFEGGTLTEFIAAIKEAKGDDAPNFRVIGPADRVPVQALSLRDVTAATAVQVGVPERAAGYGAAGIEFVRVDVIERPTERPVIQIRVGKAFEQPKNARIGGYRTVFDISEILGPGVSEYTGITHSTVMQACSLATQDAPGERDFLIHPETGLLVAVLTGQHEERLINGVVSNLFASAQRSLDAKRTERLLRVSSLARQTEQAAQRRWLDSQDDAAASGTEADPELAERAQRAVSTLHDYAQLLRDPPGSVIVILRATDDFESVADFE